MNYGNLTNERLIHYLRRQVSKVSYYEQKGMFERANEYDREAKLIVDEIISRMSFVQGKMLDV